MGGLVAIEVKSIVFLAIETVEILACRVCRNTQMKPYEI
jgi:hypothetical protein